MNDNYFCRSVLPHQRMLPRASRGKLPGGSANHALTMREHQTPRSIPAPGMHSSLESPKGAGGELTRLLRLQPLEKLLCGPVWFHV